MVRDVTLVRGLSVLLLLESENDRVCDRGEVLCQLPQRCCPGWEWTKYVMDANQLTNGKVEDAEKNVEEEVQVARVR